jgi:tetrahydromethanopterin S-methyltransferase subunit G
MDANPITAIVSASATALVAITALILNNQRFGEINQRFGDLNQRFGDINKRFDDLNGRINEINTQVNARMTRLESKLEHIEELLVGYCLDVARIKERLDIK